MSAPRDESPHDPGGLPAPRHVGDLWSILQEIAREENPIFATRSVVEHFHLGAEGGKDIERWLAIYHRRVDPAHRYRFPEHHPRYRGCCLVRRNWPWGLEWEAFDEATWKRLPLPGSVELDDLERAVDGYLDGEEQ